MQSIARGDVRMSKPWGFWMTTIMSIFVMFAWGVFQGVIMGIYAAAAAAPDLPDMEFLEGLAENGFALAVITIVSAPVGVVFALIAALACKAYRKAETGFGTYLAEYFALRPVRARSVVFWCLAGIATAAGLDYVKYLLDYPVTSEFAVNAYRTAGSVPLLLLAIVVAAPLWEEVVFRGFWYAGYARSPVSIAGAVIVPSVFWALIHLQYEWYDIVIIFFLGIVLSLARYYTRSLYAPVIMHMVLNGIAMIGVAAEEGAFSNI